MKTPNVIYAGHDDDGLHYWTSRQSTVLKKFVSEELIKEKARLAAKAALLAVFPEITSTSLRERHEQHETY